jgi:hypothetical protein
LTVNSVPAATISAPADGSLFTAGDAIAFVGSATDAEDGDLSSSLAWTSSRDGALGTGASLSRSDLSAGVHTVTATVVDAGGASDSYQISLRVNAVPLVDITAPADGARFTEGDPVSLTATATDAEDGDLAGSLSWVSDVDGNLGSGASVVRSDLSLGVHRITAEGTDSDGVASSDQITLTVSPNTPPVVTITAPPDGASVPANQVTLVGVATDAEDGDISASLMWTSSKDGFIGTGASVTPNDLSFGSHTIEASVTDRKGATSSDSVSIKVKNPKSR